MIRYSILFLGVAAITALSGCDDSAKGAGNKTDEIGADIKKGADNAGAAMSLTPDIKSAIVASPFLNEDGNLIDVDTTSEGVTLKGHVKSEKNRTMAEDIARKVMKDNGSQLPLQNKIEIVK